MAHRAIVLSILVSCLFGQDTSRRSVWNGVYSLPQAARGQAAYDEACASCHRDKLQGKGPTPALTGDGFLSNWNGMTVGDLFDKIQTSMPADRPGQLSREKNADIVSYLLKYNNFPAGAKDLPSTADALKLIAIEAKKR